MHKGAVLENKKNTTRAVFTNITVGMQLAITILIFVYGGYRLDLYYEKSPLFLALGTIIGMCLGFYHLFKELADLDKREKNAKKDGGRVRKKWN
jgi:F0F1-type ATP synthase assembly protein I